ncbi:MAG: dephospho-CoA kinase [Coriobacteriales bacterium]|nr:dephospho-CoA kinase [Coriobacteriales bacterium]
MFKLFVTGGLASGKKTVCRQLEEHGAVYYDCDRLAKSCYQDTQVQEEIRESFGDDVMRADGLVDFSALAQVAFANVEAQRHLNQLIWPRVQLKLGDILLEDTCEPGTLKAELVVVEVALLAEAPEFAQLADQIALVSCERALQIERAKRRGMSDQDILNRLALQASDEERLKLADVVFDNNGTKDQLLSQADRWYDDFKNQGRLF